MAPKKQAMAPRRAPVPPGDEVGAADVARRVAENLRQHRKRLELSLDQLAHATGVSRAALSQIETRKTNPTIGVLWKIASGLGVPFSDLIGESRLALSVLRRGDAQLLRSTDRKFESRPLVPPAGVNEIEMYELSLAAAIAARVGSARTGDQGAGRGAVRRAAHDGRRPH